MSTYRWELLHDFALLGTVLVNWLAASCIADACSADLLAKKGVSVYISSFTVLVNAYSLQRSVGLLSDPRAPKESVAGLFFEIVNLTQVWGALFATARYFSLPDEHEFYATSMLRCVSESVFEMSLVQAGVGWAGEAPTTLLERLVAWMAAYLGGVLCTNLFLVNIVLGRRGYWNNAVCDTSADRACEKLQTLSQTLFARL